MRFRCYFNAPILIMNLLALICFLLSLSTLNSRVANEINIEFVKQNENLSGNGTSGYLQSGKSFCGHFLSDLFDTFLKLNQYFEYIFYSYYMQRCKIRFLILMLI